jgi:uncharacterized caspase-like protein
MPKRWTAVQMSLSAFGGFAALLMLLIIPAFAQQSPRVALVIGNGAYRHMPALPNPASGARDMAAALRELGFTVIEGYDVDSAAMRAKISEFGAALPKADVTLLYYAGHGVEVAGKNYLIPIDAKLDQPSSLDAEAVDVGTVVADVETQKRTNLVFFEACRDNTLSQRLARPTGSPRSAAVGQGLAPMNSGGGTLIAFATSPGTAACSDMSQDNLFTAALLRHIRTPNLEIMELLKRVRTDVVENAHRKQIPWVNSSLPGDFYFRKLAKQ